MSGSVEGFPAHHQGERMFGCGVAGYLFKSCIAFLQIQVHTIMFHLHGIQPR
jgi:hypothetical protein